MNLPAEFDRIARHFAPLAAPGAFGLQDDAALLTPPAGRELVLSADAMVQGVHYLPDDPPDLVARKLLRVNLSDLAAKGADPLGYLLTISVPRETPDDWFAAFARGLEQDQTAYGLSLLGGDSTSTRGPVVLSLTILGHVAAGGMVRRAGARPGDGVWVTGTIGDGALGLLAARGEFPDPDGSLRARYRLPTPRLGVVSPATAHAAMDVSDGLVQDLGHLCRASGLAARIDAALVPRSVPDDDRLELCLTGGDDYELLLAVAPAQEAALRATGVNVTRIGMFEAGTSNVTVMHRGRKLTPARGGWSHF